jgi:hypothetical protein
MNRTENMQHPPLYSKVYRGSEGNKLPEVRSLEYPLVLLLNAIGCIVVLMLLPALNAPLNVIVGGTTAAWLLVSLLIIHLEGRKKHLRSEHLLVDPTSQELQRIMVYRGGRQTIFRYTRDQLHALIAKDAPNYYSIIVDFSSPTFGRTRWTLVDFSSAAERDALLHELAAALDLPLEAGE